jgi:hypothetical protein
LTLVECQARIVTPVQDQVVGRRDEIAGCWGVAPRLVEASVARLPLKALKEMTMILTKAWRRWTAALLAGFALALLVACGGQPAVNEKSGEGGQQKVDQKQKQADENAAKSLEQKKKDSK